MTTRMEHQEACWEETWASTPFRSFPFSPATTLPNMARLRAEWSTRLHARGRMHGTAARTNLFATATLTPKTISTIRPFRSEERRVGKEGRWRGTPDHERRISERLRDVRHAAE